MKAFADKSLRTLLLTYKEIDAKPVEDMSDDEVESGLIILGLVGI